MEYLMNIGENKYQRGATRWAQPTWARQEARRALVVAALLGPPPMTFFWYISHFDLEKNKERTFGTKRHRLEAELGQEHFCPPAERFCRENFAPGGGNRSHRHHQQPSQCGRINLHQHLHQHHLISNPSSSLVSTCGLLVVLITSCS